MDDVFEFVGFKSNDWYGLIGGTDVYHTYEIADVYEEVGGAMFQHGFLMRDLLG